MQNNKNKKQIFFLFQEDRLKSIMYNNVTTGEKKQSPAAQEILFLITLSNICFDILQVVSSRSLYWKITNAKVLNLT